MPEKVQRVTLLLTMLLHTTLVVCAYDTSRTYPVNFKNTPIALALQSLTQQSGQAINFQTQQLPPRWRVTLDTTATVLEIVRLLFKDQPYFIELTDGDIYIRLKPARIVTLRVVNPAKQALEGVTIRDLRQDSSRSGSTDADGKWQCLLFGDSLPVELTMIGHYSRRTVVYDHQEIALEENIAESDPVVIAYGKSPRRRIVGNVYEAKINFVGKPYDNVNSLLRLLPGVLVRNKTDIPWGSQSLEIEGSRTIQPLSGIRQVDEPLILINGLPCPARVGSLSQLASAAGDPSNTGAGLHPLSFLNVDDIETITVLKDASATAIYGARGANGVILIELRKPTNQTPLFNLYVMTGITSSYRRPKTLNTTEFLDLRRSAFPPGTVFDKTNFPELYMDSSLYTNWSDVLYKNTAISHTTQFSASGQVSRVSWLGSFNYRRDSYVFPTHNKDEWARFYNQLNYKSQNHKLELNSFVSASIGENATPASELTPIVFATPHAPRKLQADSLDVYNHPLRWFNSQYRAQSNYYLANLQLSYSFLKYFKVKLDGGIGWQQLKEKASFPLSYYPPDSSSRGHIDQAGRQIFTWLVEPQLHFHLARGKLSWNALLGANYQQSKYRSEVRTLPGYTSDDKLNQQLVYPTLDTFWTQYKLLSFFGRVNLEIDQRYVLEGSVRQDGSSRFAPENQFGIFYSVGGAWLLSATNFWKPLQPVINLAKLRVSHGVTGNDQVDDYGYMGQYRATNVAYQYGALPGWVQNLPASNKLTWAETRKTEAGLHLEYKKRLGLDLGAYWHRSINQVIRLPLAAQSGFSELAYWNFPVVVDNRGWDVSLHYKTVNTTNRWQTSLQLNYTHPRNLLRSFDSITTNILRQELLLSKPLTARKLYHYTGVDPITGLYTVADFNGDGKITDVDKQSIRDVEVKGYGSLSVQVKYGRWAAGFILEGRQQTGYSAISYANQRLFPGRLEASGFSNQLQSVLNRWPVANAQYQRPATSLSTAADKAFDHYMNSDAIQTDQSYVCLRHLALEYTFPFKGIFNKSINQMRLFLQGQNLVVLSRYKEGNPTLTQPFAQPVTRTFSLGAQISFK
ncbi:SusC/RagA family TonB-linked outer membrane protein [Paraflavitalea pollutisoli]|uniref:SusC/RagA family TonB-linked outer membrane protein n=1 Tax=Paraflavitalea pollutisoli TaxID=3034143 RepID=UPI0023EA86BD|nr:SusC/RagA family TonB-linked outer membrane protein [Paraflavitalea sp. H1-2-19X]